MVESVVRVHKTYFQKALADSNVSWLKSHFNPKLQVKNPTKLTEISLYGKHYNTRNIDTVFKYFYDSFNTFENFYV